MGKYIYYLFLYMCINKYGMLIYKNRVNQWIINGLKKLIFLIEHKQKVRNEKKILVVFALKYLYKSRKHSIRGLEIFDKKYLKI